MQLAFRAGAKWDEFLEWTPWMTEVWVEEREKGMLTDAWRIALLQRSKELPKKPEAIWGGAASEGGLTLDIDTMVAAGKARAAEKKQRDAEQDREKLRGNQKKRNGRKTR